MNNRRDTPIESLLKLAGERDQPSPEGMDRARVAARESWERALAERADAPVVISRRRPLAWALAAGLAALAVSGLWLRNSSAPQVVVARISAVQGQAQLQSAISDLAANAVLRSGEELITREGRVALAVGDVLSVRVDRGTRLRFDAAGRMTLLEGAVYVDSGGLNARTDLRIDTPAGEVRHVGTQFQVAVIRGQTQVRVREGRVSLTMPGEPGVELAAGDGVRVEDGRARVEHGLASFGAEWEWTAAAAPVFDIENRPMNEFLAWLAREHGWQLRFASDEVQARSLAIRLHGSLAQLDSAGAMEYVGLITGVPLTVNEGVLWVGSNP
jgi:ferric-dicitrate binding protein FerR (iron transport regulator)